MGVAGALQDHAAVARVDQRADRHADAGGERHEAAAPGSLKRTVPLSGRTTTFTPRAGAPAAGGSAASSPPPGAVGAGAEAGGSIGETTGGVTVAGPSTLGRAVMRPIRAGEAVSVNQMSPSGPRVMPAGEASALKPGAMPPVNSVMTSSSSGHRRPRRPGFAPAVNHSAPSPPSAMPTGPLFGVRPGL